MITGATGPEVCNLMLLPSGMHTKYGFKVANLAS